MTASRVARYYRRRRRFAQREGGARAGAATLAAVGGPLLALVAIGVATAAALSLFVSTSYVAYAHDIRPPLEVLDELPHGGARIYDRDGQLLYEFLDRSAGQRRPVALTQVSPWMIQATVATEDPSFFRNIGVNFRGLSRAGLENLRTLTDSGTLGGTGGSSLTQQLARNLYISPERRSERSLGRKLQETVIALELTRRYSKEQLLEWYLNSISYGGVHVGIEAAAQGYFGKHASDLSLAESALLAGIPQSPARYDPIANSAEAKGRQEQVLNLMVQDGAITRKQADSATEQELVFRRQQFDIKAPHFVLGRVADEIRRRFGERALFDDGLEVRTTLDLGLQDEAQGILERSIAAGERATGGHNGAVFATDVATGEILVYLGSRDYFRDDIEGRVDNILGLNSPGSTLKPFTYMSAFMKGWGTQTGVIDQPLKIVDPSNDKEITVRDPISTYQGVMTAANALGNSMNVTAVKAILFAGIEDTLRVLRQVGFTTLDSPYGYGPAVTIGGVDITLYDMVTGYGVLASGGVLRGQNVVTPNGPGERSIEPVAILEVKDSSGALLYRHDQPDEQRVVAESFTYLVTSILTDGKTQCITFGRCGALAIPGLPAAVKTGTSEPFEEIQTKHQAGETWALAYTPTLVAGVWFGNSDNTPLPDVLSTQVGFPVIRDFMVAAHERRQLPRDPFVQPSTVVERQVCMPSGRLPSALCPRDRRAMSLFAEEALPKNDAENRAAQDNWWRPVDGGIRLMIPVEDVAQWSIPAQQWVLGKGAFAPSQFVSNRPADGRSEGDATRRLDLSVNQSPSRNDGAASTTVGPGSDAPPFTLINSPGGGAVSGTILIRGTATAGRFQSGTINVTSASGAHTLIGVISGPVLNNQLGAWSTSAFENGPYTLQVRVTDATGASTESIVSVTVRN